MGFANSFLSRATIAASDSFLGTFTRKSLVIAF
jgi:hypothetical protein